MSDGDKEEKQWVLWSRVRSKNTAATASGNRAESISAVLPQM